jgi:hypothetical protein
LHTPLLNLFDYRRITENSLADTAGCGKVILHLESDA